MAEGWAKALHQGRFSVYSAGIEAHGLNPLAVQVMEEAGVDISSQRSERIDELAGVTMDLVVTVCGHADKNCPVLPGSCRKLHVPLDDPPALARRLATAGAAADADRGAEEGHVSGAGSKPRSGRGAREDVLQIYRRVRDEIRAFVERLPEIVEDQSTR